MTPEQAMRVLNPNRFLHLTNEEQQQIERWLVDNNLLLDHTHTIAYIQGDPTIRVECYIPDIAHPTRQWKVNPITMQMCTDIHKVPVSGFPMFIFHHWRF